MANGALADCSECHEHYQNGIQMEISPSEEEKRQITGFKWFLLVTSTLTGSFLYALDNTIVANITPVVVNEFDSVQDLPWMSVGFMIGGVSTALILGKLYTLFDTKLLFIVFTVIFMAASALCGAAPTMDAEIVGRVLAGAGGNGIYMGVLTLLSLHTTVQERPQYLSLTGLVWGLGTVLGPVVGGGFELYTWRWAFYINLVFGAILIPIYFAVIPRHCPTEGVSARQKLGRLDWTGSTLNVAGFTTLVMGINFGGTLYAWDSWQIITLFVVAGVVWISFLIQQGLTLFTSFATRLLPIHLFKQKEPALLFIACASAGIATYPSVYYIPIYFQYTAGDSAIASAVRLLPLICTLVVAIQGSGAMVSRVGYYKPWYVAGSVIALSPALVFATIVTTRTSVSIIYGLEAVLGLGLGLYVQASFAVIQAVTSPADSTYGLTMMIFAQLSGMTIGMSVTGAIFVNVAQNRLFALLPHLPREQVSSLVSGTRSGLLKTLPAATRNLTLEAIVVAWRGIFICVSIGVVVSLVCAIFLANKRANIKGGIAGA
ncbi:major facilitator superfamily domain-containing protein [Aspergillus heterothallicus]